MHPTMLVSLCSDLQPGFVRQLVRQNAYMSYGTVGGNKLYEL